MSPSGNGWCLNGFKNDEGGSKCEIIDWSRNRADKVEARKQTFCRSCLMRSLLRVTVEVISSYSRVASHQEFLALKSTTALQNPIYQQAITYAEKQRSSQPTP